MVLPGPSKLLIAFSGRFQLTGGDRVGEEVSRDVFDPFPHRVPFCDEHDEHCGGLLFIYTLKKGKLAPQPIASPRNTLQVTLLHTQTFTSFFALSCNVLRILRA